MLDRPHIEAKSFAIDGFALVPEVLAGDECESIAMHAANSAAGSAGTRCLLPQTWCSALAKRLRNHPALTPFIPSSFVATQCTYFEKSRSRNWLVAVHQDLSIPVAARMTNSRLQGWSEKEGAIFVQPPVGLLQQLLAVRVYIDECTPTDGPLRVVAGSHLSGRIETEAAALARQTQGEMVCAGARGSALVMRPLLLHASSKSTGTSKRRVLHSLFGPRQLPHGLRWQHAV